MGETLKLGSAHLSKSSVDLLTKLPITPQKKPRYRHFERSIAKKIDESRNLSDRFEILMESLVVYCYEANFKVALKKLLQEFLGLNPQYRGCCYRILMNESTFDVFCPIIGEVRDGKLSDEIGDFSHQDDDSRVMKILNNFDSFKEIFNDA